MCYSHKWLGMWEFCVGGLLEHCGWIIHQRKPFCLCLLECRSFRRLHNVQGFWTSTTERFKKGGGCQTKTQWRAQWWQNKGRGRGLGHANEVEFLYLSWRGCLPNTQLKGFIVWVTWTQTSLHHFLSHTVKLHVEVCCLNSLQVCSEDGYTCRYNSCFLLSLTHVCQQLSVAL